MRVVKVTNEPGTCLHVLEVDDSVTTMTGGLGITEERAAELEKIVGRSYADSNNIIQVMVGASKQCKHANELYMCSVILHHMHASRNNPLAAILGGMVRGKGDDKN